MSRILAFRMTTAPMTVKVLVCATDSKAHRLPIFAKFITTPLIPKILLNDPTVIIMNPSEGSKISEYSSLGSFDALSHNSEG
jgi:hypothetical protein